MLLCAPARATVLQDWSLEERIAHADQVVVGKVIAQEATRLDGNIVTESTIAVSRTLFGRAGNELVITQLGGSLGEDTLRVPGTPLLTVGDEVVLIVKLFNGRNRLVGMGLGAFFLRGRLAYQRIDVPLMGADGRLRRPPGEQTFDLERIRGAAEEVRRTLQRTELR